MPTYTTLAEEAEEALGVGTIAAGFGILFFDRGMVVFRPNEEADPAVGKLVRCLGISEDAPRL